MLFQDMMKDLSGGDVSKVGLEYRGELNSMSEMDGVEMMTMYEREWMRGCKELTNENSLVVE